MEYLEQFCGLTAIEACHRGPEQCSCWLQWRFIRSEFGAPWAMQCLTGMTALVLTSCCPNDVHDRVEIKMRNVLIFFRKTLVDCWNKDFFAKHRKNVHKSYNEECCLSVPEESETPRLLKKDRQRWHEEPFAIYTNKCLEFINFSSWLGTGCEAVGQEKAVKKSHDHELSFPSPRSNTGFWRWSETIIS